MWWMKKIIHNTTSQFHRVIRELNKVSNLQITKQMWVDKFLYLFVCTGERDSWQLRKTGGGGFSQGAIVIPCQDICSFLLFKLTLPPLPYTHTHTHTHTNTLFHAVLWWSKSSFSNSKFFISPTVAANTKVVFMFPSQKHQTFLFKLSPLSPSCGVERTVASWTWHRCRVCLLWERKEKKKGGFISKSI